MAVDTLYVLELVWYIVSCMFSTLVLIFLKEGSLINKYPVAIFIVPLLIKLGIKNHFYVTLKKVVGKKGQLLIISLFRILCLVSVVISILCLFDAHYNYLPNWFIVILNTVIGLTGICDQTFWYLVSEKNIHPIKTKGESK